MISVQFYKSELSQSERALCLDYFLIVFLVNVKAVKEVYAVEPDLIALLLFAIFFKST